MYTYESYLHTFGSICLSSGMETRDNVRERIGPSDGLGLGVKKRALVSCVLYVVVRY